MKAGFWLIAIALLMTGCVGSWDDESAPDLQGTGAMKSVSAFVKSNGWNMSTNNSGTIFWDGDKTALIKDLPWTKYGKQQFGALTKDGILFVLTRPGWHHDVAGVAYNPNTNRFPPRLDGFKPIGQHWYVWCELEFAHTNLDRIYE